MTGSEAIEFLGFVKTYIQCAGFSVQLSPKKSIRDGMTVFDDYTVTRCEIGIKEFSEKFDQSVSDIDIMIPLVGMFHETFGHQYQMMKLFEKDTPLTRVIGLNHYACRSSSYYYGYREKIVDIDGEKYFETKMSAQYFRQPHEIAAQYAGIRACHSFLSWKLGDPEKSADLIRKYVQYRVKHGTECIKSVGDKDTVQNILTRFNMEFQRSVFRKRDYGIGSKQNDFLIRFGKPGDRKLVTFCPDGLRQDLLMAIPYIRNCNASDYIMKRGAFAALNLSMDHARNLLKQPVEPRPKTKDLSLGELDSVLDQFSEQAQAAMGMDTGPPGPDFGD